MMPKIGFWLLWLGFITYAFIFAPPDRVDTITLITNLSTGKLEGINPLIVALFNIMGIWPMIYSCVLFSDGRGQKIPAWVFALLSFAVGAFALLPYLALRQPNPHFYGKKKSLSENIRFSFHRNFINIRCRGISIFWNYQRRLERLCTTMANQSLYSCNEFRLLYAFPSLFCLIR